MHVVANVCPWLTCYLKISLRSTLFHSRNRIADYLGEWNRLSTTSAPTSGGLIICANHWLMRLLDVCAESSVKTAINLLSSKSLRPSSPFFHFKRSSRVLFFFEQVTLISALAVDHHSTCLVSNANNYQVQAPSSSENAERQSLLSESLGEKKNDRKPLPVHRNQTSSNETAISTSFRFKTDCRRI